MKTDTLDLRHMGSGSIAIAAHYAGVHLTACEIDADYYEAACERIESETRKEKPATEFVTCFMSQENN